MKKFALIGVAGFIAPRHLKAIKETGNTLVAALDKFDQVGILDSYFPQVDFFTEFERFDRHIDKLKRQGTKIDYVSICTPNYLHDSHIRFALRHQADAICEKPLVLNPWNVDALAEIEKETGRKVTLSDSIFGITPNNHAIYLDVKQYLAKIYDVDLTYITSRGNWYFNSWKGDMTKSGGVATNIGIHFFDMLAWVFGKVKHSEVHKLEADLAAGYIELDKARVRWMLSINANHLPKDIQAKGQRTFRSIQMEVKEIEFSEGFTDLHTKSYAEILKGNGFGLNEARQSIELVHEIRTTNLIVSNGNLHPMVNTL